MIEGSKVSVGGEEYVIPPLNIKLLKKHQETLDKLTSPEAIAKMGFSGYATAAVPVLGENLRRNYPELTDEKLEEILPVSQVAVWVKAMFQVSGFGGEGGERPLVPAADPNDPNALRTTVG